MTDIDLQSTVQDQAQNPVPQLWAIIGKLEQVADIGDMFSLRLTFMRKIPRKQRVQG